MKAGFIGLGQMGLAIARNLLRAKHTVTVYNRTRARAEMLRPEGAVVADEPAQACTGEVLITMLADDQAVEQVVFGNDLIASLPRGAVHVSMSTISVALSARLAEAHRRAGQEFVSAPVFGRPEAAEAGKLTVVAAGPAEAVARCQPLFDAIGQQTFVVGDEAPKANTVKLAGNFLVMSATEALGEAYALLRKSGVDPESFLEVMTSNLFAAPVYKIYGNLIAKEAFEPAGFKVQLGLKDASLVLAAAGAVSAPMPIASLVRDHFLTAIARGRSEQDWSSLGKIAAENAGLS